MELGLIRKVDLDDEMQQSYLDYAMSVIVARALPDARDGLKPVQRRILYAMYDMGLRADAAYKKSARIVGEVLGKYHPHGDMAVYESMARMAQDFSMRSPLVDGQGNFGSVDGDPPAAMRYTEARLTAIAMEMLNQIEKNTVDFIPNFDETLHEPVVLPAAIPNLLVNGATGIAVGMATNIPPHNLGEVVDALVYMLEKWDQLDDLSVENLLRFIQGPDFPTGGVIIQDPLGEGLMSAYGSGRGKVIVQARAHLEEMVRGRNRIIVTELPYQTNKATLIERIAELVREGHLEGIADLRDESDRQGMRIVIELNKTADPEKILRELYQRTPMQSTFGINLLALVDGEPRLLTLKQALRVYLEHRLQVIRRRSEFDLERARQRAHILEGLRVALKNLDEVISLIRNSTDVDQARQRLIRRFRLSEVQAQAILDMALRRLASLERKKIELEYKEVLELIKNLESLLKSSKKMRQAVTDELLAVKQTYSDRRRTTIARLKEGASTASLLTTTDVTPAQGVWVGVTSDGKIARMGEETLPEFRQDAPRWLVRTDTHQTLYLVSTQGKAAAIPVHAVPEGDLFSMGAPVGKISPLEEGDRLAALFTLPAGTVQRQDHFVVTATREGLVKKTAAGELPGPSAQTFTLVKVNEGDALGWVQISNGQEDYLLATANGMAIRFREDEVRPMGLVAAGVGGIKLAAGDMLRGMVSLAPSGELFLLASDGKAKRVALGDFPLQGRYGQGAVAWKFSRDATLVGVAASSIISRGIAHLSTGEAPIFKLNSAAVKARTAQGERLLALKPGEKVLFFTEVNEPAQANPPAEKPKPRRRPAAPPDGSTPKPPAKNLSSAQKPAPLADRTRAAAVSEKPKRAARQAAPIVKSPAKKKAAPSKLTQKPTPTTQAPAALSAVEKPHETRRHPAEVKKPLMKIGAGQPKSNSLRDATTGKTSAVSVGKKPLSAGKFSAEGKTISGTSKTQKQAPAAKAEKPVAAKKKSTEIKGKPSAARLKPGQAIKPTAAPKKAPQTSKTTVKARDQEQSPGPKTKSKTVPVKTPRAPQSKPGKRPKRGK
ncbi:MAG: DNA gyrase subunit A [Chloroflexi bacterium]|nr:DNA gyrase subunit A [Chloroflexota bacterium]